MNKFFFRLAFAAAALLPASSVLAADLDAPPVDDLRPATFDWSGPYVGAFVGGISENGTFDTTCVACGIYTRENSGWGWNGGVNAGWNYQMDSFVMGIEGDWAFGGRVAQNRAPTEMTEYEFNNIASLRARAGLAFDDTLLYAVGGVAFVTRRSALQISPQVLAFQPTIRNGSQAGLSAAVWSMPSLIV